MVLPSTMGATSRRMPTRRRLNSVDKETQMEITPVVRNGYYSETTSRRSNNNHRGFVAMHSTSNATTNNNSHQLQLQPQQPRQMMRRRGSTGLYYESSQQTHPLSKFPPKPPFHSDEEEGEASDNSSCVNSYNSCCDVDEHDSQDSSSSPSLEEGNHYNKALQYNDNNHTSSCTNPATTTPMSTKITRPISERSNGNKSDPELGSSSVHKRALHEAAMPISVLKGNINKTNGNNCSNNNEQQKQQLHNSNKNTITNGRRTIVRTGSDGSESSTLPPEYMVVDDSTKSRISALDNNTANNSSISMERGNGAGSPTISPNLKITERILTSKVWRILRTKNPIFLLLVTGVSMMGVGLYTQSYATLSITLDQVITNTNERRKRVEGHFDSIEKDMQVLQRKLLELHPDASVMLSSSDNQVGMDNTSFDEEEGANRQEFLRDASASMFDEIVAVKERIHMENSRINSFERYIQETSLRDATRKYGTGVLRVQLTLDFLSDRDQQQQQQELSKQTRANAVGESTAQQQQQQQQKPHTLILEMAPLELMPHSVYTFLEMVDNKLFDGCSFILNAMNIIKAAPLPYEKGLLSAKEMDQNFHKLNLETVSFSEYSSKFPHEQYTVGFAADGSPDFYINTGDNTDEHAGEPCFARIVSGFETVQKMEAEPLRSGMWIKKRIGIKKAMVL